MNMSKNAVIVAVMVVILVLIGWMLLRQKQTPAPTPSSISTPSSTQSAAPAASEGAVMKEEKTVKITTNGFSPQNVTIKAGKTVTWVNSDSVDHTVNSVVHPTHLVYPPLNLGDIKSSQKKSLVFPTAGTYRYHDHLNPSLTGSVTVQ